MTARKTLIGAAVCLILTGCVTPPKPVETPTPEQVLDRPAEPANIPSETPQRCTDAQTPCYSILAPAEIVIDTFTPETPKAKQYPRLEYGHHQELVCSAPYMAEKELAARPNLQLMWENYIYEKPERVWEEVGGAVEVNGCLPEDKGRWQNACTVRLSHMLNKADHKIPYIDGQTVSGANGDHYLFRLEDAQNYLERVLGPPDYSEADASGRYIELPNHPGLLIMRFPGSGFTGHATIWNGAGTVDGTDVVGFEIYFWKLPCFEPIARLNSDAARD